MEAEQVAKRYAHGLFDLTQEKGVSERVHEDFNDLAMIIKEDRQLLEFLAAPQILDQDKSAVIDKAFKGKVADQLFHLLQLLVIKRRTNFIEEIAKEYEALVYANKGIVSTRLVSAVPLSDQEVSEIKARVSKLTGKSIEIVVEVDPAIIGGVIAFVGEKIIDRSIRHELDVLREQLLELKVN